MPKKTVIETRLYPVIFHREGDAWGYFSPEFGGGGAPTQTDAIRLAQDMLGGAVAQIIADQEPIPNPSELDKIDVDGGQIAWFPITVSNAAERIFVTLPKTLLAQIDAATNNRSAFFAELARERLATGQFEITHDAPAETP